jgi:hypothetical protein
MLELGTILPSHNQQATAGGEMVKWRRTVVSVN